MSGTTVTPALATSWVAVRSCGGDCPCPGRGPACNSLHPSVQAQTSPVPLARHQEAGSSPSPTPSHLAVMLSQSLLPTLSSPPAYHAKLQEGATSSYNFFCHLPSSFFNINGTGWFLMELIAPKGDDSPEQVCGFMPPHFASPLCLEQPSFACHLGPADPSACSSAPESFPLCPGLAPPLWLPDSSQRAAGGFLSAPGTHPSTCPCPRRGRVPSPGSVSSSPAVETQTECVCSNQTRVLAYWGQSCFLGNEQ